MSSPSLLTDLFFAFLFPPPLPLSLSPRKKNTHPRQSGVFIPEKSNIWRDCVDGYYDWVKEHIAEVRGRERERKGERKRVFSPFFLGVAKKKKKNEKTKEKEREKRTLNLLLFLP